MTTNGVGLARALPALRREGLTALNLSLDTLDRGQYAAITRRGRSGGRPGRSGRRAGRARAAGSSSTACPWGRTTPNWSLWPPWRGTIPWRCALSSLCPSVWAGLSPAAARRRSSPGWSGPSVRRSPAPRGGGSGPGHYVTFAGFSGRVGFISALSHPFCTGCNRVRLTASGFLKTCLQYDAGVDLRALLRGGAPECAASGGHAGGHPPEAAPAPLRLRRVRDLRRAAQYE